MKLPKFSSLSARERLLVSGVILVVSVLLLDRVVLGPWLSRVQEVGRSIQRLKGTIRTYQQLLARRDQILAQIAAYGPYLKQVGRGPLDVASLLREIETLGKESGISLGEIKPLATQGDDGSVQEYVFEIHSTCTLKQWIHFVYLLQSSNSLFQVDRATVAATEGNPGVLDSALRLTRRIPKTSGAGG